MHKAPFHFHVMWPRHRPPPRITSEQQEQETDGSIMTASLFASAGMPTRWPSLFYSQQKV